MAERWRASNHEPRDTKLLGPELDPVAGTIEGMCRSIKRLREGDVPATETEIREAALQFVRKVSGYRAPSKRNEEAFKGAVDEVADASRRLLEAVTHSA